jgi:pimeloyl-ACP methyl ester carboxylesterase
MVRVIAQSGARQVHWLGTSMGGIIGMLLAAQANTPITRLVLNDVGPIIPKASLERIAMYVGVSPVFHSLEEAVAAVRTVSPFGPITDAQWLALTRPLLKQRADGSWQFRYDPAIGDAFKGRTLADVDLNPYWRQVHCPTLITRGAESDLLTRETFEAMCAWPNVRGHEFAHTGHAPMFQTAEAIAVVRRFLLEQ